jgi:hypothetical protein
MKNEEYERAYYAAREILHNRGKRVGCPVFGLDLVRFCPVDGILVNDLDLLRDAWGDRLVREILMELSESDSLPNCCPEGNRLWEEYSDAGRLNLEILIKQQTAASKNDPATVTQLGPALHQAAEARLRHRRSVLEHAAAHNL